MEAIKEKISKILKNEVGERVVDSACIFCGNNLGANEFCTCRQSKKINKYYKKLNDYYSSIFSLFYDTYEGKKSLLELRSVKVPGIFAGMTLSDYVIKNESQKAIVKAITQYKENLIKNFTFGTNLILYGNYRTGKTMTMSILAQDIAEQGFTVYMFNAVDLVNDIKRTFDAKNNLSTGELLNRISKVDFLFIDDVDKINPTQYVQELMYGIVNCRKESEKPTIISMNHNLEELDEKYFGEAVVSRLAAQAVIVNYTHENWELGK